MNSVFGYLKIETESGDALTKPENTVVSFRDIAEYQTESKYLLYFPEAELPVEKTVPHRSSCLRIGACLVLRRIIEEYHLDELLADIIGSESGLFLDIAVHTIITENNAGQYYPDYAYNHPLFTEGMRIYSDAKVSMFINGIRSMDRCGYDFVIMMKGECFVNKKQEAGVADSLIFAFHPLRDF